MSNAEPNFAELLRDIAEERSSEDHPRPEDLIAYQDGVLEEEEAEAIRDHLADCFSCTQTVLDLQNFPDIEPSPDVANDLSKAEIDQAWKTFHATATSLKRRLPPERLIAAALLVVSLGLGFLLLQRSGPRTELHLVDLSSYDVRLSQTVERITLRPPVDAERLILVLQVPEIPAFSAYRVRLYNLEDGDEAIVWRKQGLKPSPDGKLVLDLPRRLAPETFRLELLNDQDPPELLATYPGRVQN